MTKDSMNEFNEDISFEIEEENESDVNSFEEETLPIDQGNQFFGNYDEDEEDDEDLNFFGFIEENDVVEEEKVSDDDLEFDFGEDSGSFTLDLEEDDGESTLFGEILEETETDGLLDEISDITGDLESVEDDIESVLEVLGMTDDQVDEIINNINDEITHFNLMQDSINYRTIEAYSKGYKSTMVTNQSRSDMGEGYTPENLNALKKSRDYAEFCIENEKPLILSQLTRGLQGIQDTLYRVLEKDIDEIVMKSDELITKDMEIGKLEDKERLRDTLNKIISAFEPKIKTDAQVQEHDIKELNKAQKRLRTRRQFLAPIDKETVEAVYEIISITEVTDEGTTLSESRNFMEIRARRVYEADVTIPLAQFNEKYKEEINLRVPINSAELVVYKITNRLVQNNYNLLVNDLGWAPKDLIVKPIAYRYKKALVTFISTETTNRFVELIRPQLEDLARERKNSDLVVGISAGSKNYEGRFKRKIQEKKPIYPRYTQAEIEDRLNKMIIEDSMHKIVKSTTLGVNDEILVFGVSSKPAYHKFNTPTRSFIKTALSKYKDEFEITTDNKEASENLIKIFEEYKRVIVPEVLTETFTYLKNIKKSFEVALEEQGSVDVNFSLIADILTFGEEKDGFVDKFLKYPVKETYIDEVTGKEIERVKEYKTMSLNAFLSKEENIDAVKFGDIFGRNKEEYKSRNEFNIVKHNGSNRISMKLEVALNNIDIDVGSRISNVRTARKGGEDMKSELIQIPPITEGIDNYLKSIANAVLEVENNGNLSIGEDVVDSIINVYKSKIEPLHEGMTLEQAFSNPTISNSTPTKEIRSGAKEIRLELVRINTKVAVEGNKEHEYNMFLRSARLSEILGNTKWETAPLQDTEFFKDFMKVAPLVGIVKGAEEVIYSTLENIDPENIDLEYTGDLLLTLLNLPNKDMEINDNPTAYNIGIDRLDRVTDIPDLQNNHPIPIMRDITFFNNLLSNKGYIRRIERAVGTGREERTIEGLVDRVLGFTEEPTKVVVLDEVEFNTKVMSNYVDDILKTICYTNIDYIMLKQSILNKRFYQSKGRAKKQVEEDFNDYYFNELEVEELVELKDLIYWIESTTVLPSRLNLSLLMQYNQLEENIKSKLQRKATVKGSVREIKASTRKMNAYYKSYLKTGDKKFLENIDRDYVDFELLTQLPTVDSVGGEYNIYAMIDRYEIEEVLEDISEGDRYLELVILIEKYHPNIKEELPLSIVKYIEETIVTQVTNKEVIDMLKGDTKFNLNYKSV